MTSYIALEAPAWLAVLATLALFAAGIALGALAATVAQLFRARARAPALDERDTIPAPTPSIELPADRDTLPDFPWHTSVRS